MPDAPPAEGDTPRLLVADDDPGFRRAIAFLLVGSGYQVTEARDGREALRAIEASRRDHAPFEILVLDLLMDGATGWQVHDHVHETAAPGEVLPRTLFVTGYPEVGDHARARSHDAASLLVKPIPAEALLAEIRRLERIPRDIPAIHDHSGHLTTTG